MPPVDKDQEELKEDRGDEFIPPGMETEDPEDDDFEELDPQDEDEEDEDEDDEESDDDDEESDDDDEESDDDDEEDSDEDDDDSDSDDEDDEDEDEDDGVLAEEEQRIPKGRLNQVLKQRDEEREHRKWLEQQLETLIRAQTKAEEKIQEEEAGPPEYDFDEAETQYAQFLMEGDIDKAAKLRSAISDAREELYHYQIEAAKKAMKSEAVQETTSSLDEVRFNALIGEYTEQFDFLNDQSDGYNEKAVTMANKLMSSYIAEGKSKSEALKAAVGDIVPLFAKAETAAAPTKRKTEVRKKAARKKAAKASRQQPPAAKGARGKAERKFSTQDIMNMSEKEFNSLTAREKAKLRGDIA